MFLKLYVPKNGVIKEKSIEIFIRNGRIIWLLGIEGSVKSGINSSIFDIACFNKTSIEVY